MTDHVDACTIVQPPENPSRISGWIISHVNDAGEVETVFSAWDQPEERSDR